MKKLRTILTLAMVCLCSWQSAWAQEELTVSVSLKEPGGLATEIRAAQGVEHEKYVVNLTVTSGELNDDDWATLKLMDALKTLDLEKTTNKSLPKGQFYDVCPNLQIVKLPSQLETIGEDAFQGKNYLISCILPSSLTSIGDYAFNGCPLLENIGSWPARTKEIPHSCFGGCYKLTFDIPEGVTSIGYYAFWGCKIFKSKLPSTLNYIGNDAFRDCSMEDIDVIIPEKATIGALAFENTKIRSIQLPSNIYGMNFAYSYVNNCNNLKDVTILSPTVFSTSGGFNKNATIHVPSHLVNAYLSHPYWYNFTIKGFDITEHDIVWQVNQPLHLNAYTRMAGTPDIRLARNVSLTISGDDAQKFRDITTIGHSVERSLHHNLDWAQIISTCDNVTMTGNYQHIIETYQKQWYFICLPFDIKVSDITTENDVKYAIRYYDGANRASKKAPNGNWKNYASDAVIPAGTGFIYQTSGDTWTTFKALENDSRNNALSNKEFVKTLAANKCNAAAHKGWNLVGNPWQCYYNIHKLNFTAPISVYQNGTYVAYSLSDDDYAIEPNQAFFVQCPNAVTSIGFPTEGRQLTDEITSANGARSKSPANSMRKLVDLRIENGEQLSDKTRLVVNEEALMDYEMTCDASKMMSLDTAVPQIYSLDADDTPYAINERPMDNGTLRLGIIIKDAGEYTISAIRNDLGRILLIDHETGITTDLQQGGYVFSAESGTYQSRFSLSFGDNSITGIKVATRPTADSREVYTLDGRKVSNSTDQLKQGVYVVREGQKTQKVIIK